MRSLHRSAQRTLVLRTVLALPGVLALSLAGACGGASSVEPLPNVILVVLEEARADHVSCYGYGRPTTPALDAFAASGVRFTRCRTTSPGTQASLASMFTGRFTYQHGAHPVLPGHELIERPLELGRETLAEALAAGGYSTAAFVSDEEFLADEYQLDQGFEEFVAESGGGGARNTRVFEWLERVEGPFFLCVTYADARSPHNTVPLEDERRGEFAVDGVVPSETLLEELRAEFLGVRRVTSGGVASAAILSELHARYELGLANADKALGELLDHLRAAGLFEDSLVIVTSDHGTYFGEHGLIGHSKDVYEEALHVPLVLRQAGDQIQVPSDALLSVADVPGLVAAAMPAALRGRLQASFPLQLGRDVSLAELYHSRAIDVRRYGDRFRRVRKVFYSDGHKLIRSSDGRNELYDLHADSEEIHDLAGTETRLVMELSQGLLQFLREHPEEPLLGVDPGQANNTSTERRLREVGYPGGMALDDD
jgi:arylsulfatase A-like enzyme